MVSLLSVWHYFRYDTNTIRPHVKVPHNKLNLGITWLVPDLYPGPFLKESRIKVLTWEVECTVWNWLERTGNFSGSRRRNLGPYVPSSLLALLS